MLIWKLTIISFLLLGVGARGQQQHYVVLSAHAAGEIAKQGTWQPTKVDIDNLEADLSKISKLKAENWHYKISIDDPERYFRQYVAVVRPGGKRIYVNAFCDDQDLPYWRDHLIVVDDGATCFWQAIYDPATRNFSNLTINGRG